MSGCIWVLKGPPRGREKTKREGGGERGVCEGVCVSSCIYEYRKGDEETDLRQGGLVIDAVATVRAEKLHWEGLHFEETAGSSGHEQS